MEGCSCLSLNRRDWRVCPWGWMRRFEHKGRLLLQRLSVDPLLSHLFKTDRKDCSSHCMLHCELLDCDYRSVRCLEKCQYVCGSSVETCYWDNAVMIFFFCFGAVKLSHSWMSAAVVRMKCLYALQMTKLELNRSVNSVISRWSETIFILIDE